LLQHLPPQPLLLPPVLLSLLHCVLPGQPQLSPLLVLLSPLLLLHLVWPPPLVLLPAMLRWTSPCQQWLPKLALCHYTSPPQPLMLQLPHWSEESLHWLFPSPLLQQHTPPEPLRW
jgi:hypothetical protein